MPIQLTLLGTGGALCDLRHNYHTNAVLHTAEGPFLIDCGCTAPQSMKEINIPLWEVCGVFLTHMHADHAGGVEQLLWERYYTGPKGPSWLPTDIYGPNAIKDALRRSLMDNVDTVSGGQGITYAGGYDILVKWTNVRAGGPGFAVGGPYVPRQAHAPCHGCGRGQTCLRAPGEGSRGYQRWFLLDWRLHLQPRRGD